MGRYYFIVGNEKSGVSLWSANAPGGGDDPRERDAGSRAPWGGGYWSQFEDGQDPGTVRAGTRTVEPTVAGVSVNFIATHERGVRERPVGQSGRA